MGHDEVSVNVQPRRLTRQIHTVSKGELLLIQLHELIAI